MVRITGIARLEDRVKTFKYFLNDKKYKTYFLKDQEQILKLEFHLRGIDTDHMNFMTIENLQKLRDKKKVRIFEFLSLMQWFIDTPIRKDILSKVIKIN